MAGELEFEKPVVELREKISELKKFTQDSDMDLSSEITKLEARLERLEEDIYTNLKAWDRVQIARHPNRPTTLDYIEHLFTDFLNATEIVISVMMKQLSAELPSSGSSCDSNRSAARQGYKRKHPPQFRNAAS